MRSQLCIVDNELRSCIVKDCHLVIPEGIKSIADHCFSNADGNYLLTSVVLPSSVEVVGVGAFSGCYNLRKVVILGAAELQDAAFSGCVNLELVWLSDKVRSLGMNCFSNCKSLKSLYIPESVETVGGYLSQQKHPEKSTLRFLCGVKEKPSGWDDNWNAVLGAFSDSNDVIVHEACFGRSRSWFPSFEYALSPFMPEMQPVGDDNAEWNMLKIYICRFPDVDYRESNVKHESTTCFARPGSSAEQEFPPLAIGVPLPLNDSLLRDYYFDAKITVESVTPSEVTVKFMKYDFGLNPGETFTLFDNSLFYSHFLIKATLV